RRPLRQVALGDLFFFQAEDGIRDFHVTGVQTCALPICRESSERSYRRTTVATSHIPPSLYAAVKRAPAKCSGEVQRMPSGACKQIGRASCRERGETLGVAGRGDQKQGRAARDPQNIEQQ